MTSRERVQTLLRKEIPDRMGLYEHFWGETLRDYWPNQGYPKDANPEEYFDYDIQGCGGWFDTAPFPGVKEIVKETEEWQVIRDGRGSTMKTWKKKSGTPEHVGFDLTTPEKWPKYREPLMAVNKARLGDLEAIRKKMDAAREKGKFVVFGNLFVYELMRATIGDEHFLPSLLLEKEWLHDFCQVYLDMYKRHYEILFREAGLPDGFWIYEDFGYNKGLFCSPGTLAEMVMPYEKMLVSFFKDYGLPVILHTCGDIRQAIPLIIDAGFDCLQPMEAKAGCDVVTIAREFGRKISYMGNVNVVPLSTNDRSQVDAEIIPKLKALKEMRIPYFFHSDHSVPPSINFDTYRYALDLLREHGMY